MTECKHCNQGHIPVGENFVTQDMATDAGEPDMVGMSLGIEWDACDCCGGEGWEDCPNCTEEEEKHTKICQECGSTTFDMDDYCIDCGLQYATP
jgi:hypothetical protein